MTEANTARTALQARYIELLKDDFSLKKTLGCGKSVLVTYDVGVQNDLTQHRLKLTAEAVIRIYTQAGWTITKDSPDLHWHLTCSSQLPKSESSEMMLDSEHDKDDDSRKLRRLVCGVITNKHTKKREREVTLQCYFKLREGDLKENADRSVLVNSLVQLEFLQARHVAPLTLDLSPGCVPQRVNSSKGALFILYNYARVATILQKHRNLVEKGQYPPLSPVENVAPLLLSSKAEQELMSVSLERYSALITNVEVSLSSDLFPSPHKICRFLDDMCKILSRFYRTNHILTEPRPHLLPIMHARLHMMAAICRVMEHALGLLGVTPPQHM